MEQHQQAASTNWFNMSFLTLQFLCLLGKGEKAKVVPIAIVLSFWHYVLPPGDMELSEISELSELSTYRGRLYYRTIELLSNALDR